MSLTRKDAKSILAALSGEASAKRLALMVGEANPMGGVSRYFFVLKIGGHGKGALAIKYALNHIGNIGAAIPGAGATGLGALGSNLATAGGKAGGLNSFRSGRSGPFGAGAIASFSDTEDMNANRNFIYVLKEHNGIQGFGFLDLISEEGSLEGWNDEIGLWLRATDPGQNWTPHGWDNFIKMLYDPKGGGKVGYTAKGRIFQDVRMISLKGLGQPSLSY